MKSMVITFSELAPGEQEQAGGKGGTLARLFQGGYPVPEGFVIMPPAFVDETIKPEAWQQVVQKLEGIRKQNGKTAFAVRSSALSEDSAFASFAGEFETVLDVHTDEAIRAAIHQVHHSRKSERVRAYSQAKGMAELQDISVVVQKLIRADISGILFTADPVTGSRFVMTGNFVYGFGEELVSGEVEPYTFTLGRPKGKYEGPEDLKRYGKKLYKLACRLEDELGHPQDIEWAIEDGKLYLLQSRPITTLLDFDIESGEWNSSLSGDYIWMGSEVFPDVLTLSTYSIFQHFHNYEIEGMRGTGNIGGRFYMNYTLMSALLWAFGRNREYLIELIENTTGLNLGDVTMPEAPVSRWKLIRSMLPIQKQLLPMQMKLMKRFDEIISSNPGRCQALHERIVSNKSRGELVDIWNGELYPLFFDLLMVQDKSNEDYFFPYISAKKQLVELVGKEQANALLAKMVGGSGQLTSIAPLWGLEKVAKGEMDRERYSLLAGHRPQQEDELSVPRPYEDPDWIDKRLAEYRENPVDYAAMLDQRAVEYQQAWNEFAARFPKEAPKVKKKLDKTLAAMEKREVIRSELTRILGVIRAWFLRAGELTGLGDGVFHLMDNEVLDVLAGDQSATGYIPNRRETYERQKSLPKYPVVISGRFDPYTWAQDPNRRNDVYDSHAQVKVEEESDTIKGFPGSAGRVEGIVRILHSPTDSGQFNTGEILVASSTNVGWTPLFPRASAVITDVGAPLSHAAIVAREFGIPAVVGTGNATMRLNTGDRVLVDGSQGWVKLMENSPGAG